MKKLYSQALRPLWISLTLFIFSNSSGQTIYTWNLAGNGDYQVAANWSPSRAIPASNDILVFNNGGTKLITNVPTQTIGKLQVTNNTNISLRVNTSANATLTVSTAATDAITVASGSTLQLLGARVGGSGYGLTLTTANTAGLEANISGTVIVRYDDPTRATTLGVFTKGGANATINFNSGSLYTHNVDGSLIPTANWNVNSTCNITGLTNNAPSGLNQSFGNVTYDCSGHAALINFNSQLQTINGDFSVKFAGQVQGIRTINGLALSSNTSFTLNIGGDLIVDQYSTEATWLILTTGTANVTVNIAGDFVMSNSSGSGACFFDYKYGTGTAMGTLVINVSGNLTMTGGYLDMAYQASGYTVNTELRLAGNLSHTGSSTLISSGGSLVNGKIIFNKAGTQTVYAATPGNIAYVNFEVSNGSTVQFLSNLYVYSYASAIKAGNFNVLSGGVIDFDVYQLLSSSGSTAGSNNSFTLNSGAGVITANANGLQNTAVGSVSTSIATRTYNSGANYTYDGTAVQNSGIFTTTPVTNQVANLTINNTAGSGTTGVTLQQPIAVSGNCAFTSGILTTSSTNLLTIKDNATTTVTTMTAANTSFCDGPMKKIGNDAFTFHVGDRLGGYRYCGITAPNNATDAFTAEFIRSPANASPRNILASPGPPPLQGVSRCEYWTIDRTSGNSDVGVTLSWNGLSPCNVVAYVTNPANIVVAHFNGIAWNKHGRTSSSGAAGSGDVTWTGLTGGFNTANTPFALGTLSSAESPLPVKFTVSAFKTQNGNKVEWTNYTEQGVNSYELERSQDGRTFTSLHTQSATLNNGSKTDYNWTDANSFSPISFYRIKAIDITGTVTYSSIVKVQSGASFMEGVLVYPNPIISNEFTLQLTQPAGVYKIKLMNNFGQEIMNTQWNHNGGSASRTFELPESLNSGIYYLQVIGNNQTIQTKIGVQ